MIHLVGPGGAGKSTVAPQVAALLRCPVLDLDRLFEAERGNIDSYIQAHGYAAYARANVDLYLANRSGRSGVFALSSGFITYSQTVHPAVAEIHRELVAAPTTVLLLPSLDDEICVSEIVRRQRARPFAIHRSAAREEAVIRERLAVYRRLPTRVVTTMQPVMTVARAIIGCI